MKLHAFELFFELFLIICVVSIPEVVCACI